MTPTHHPKIALPRGHLVALHPWVRRATLTLVLAMGCGLLRLTVEESATTVVEGAGVLGAVLSTLDFGGFDDFDVTIEQELEDQGVEPGDLRSVVVTTLRLSAEPDLAFLEHLEVYVSGDGVQDVLVASGDAFPQGQPVVDLDMTDVDIQSAVIAGEMRFRVEATGSLPQDDVELTTLVVVDVDATAQGACRQAGGSGP